LLEKYVCPKFDLILANALIFIYFETKDVPKFLTVT